MGAFSQVDDRIRNVTGVVHLAAIPAPGLAKARKILGYEPKYSLRSEKFGL
jgi:hypothetical protein